MHLTFGRRVLLVALAATFYCATFSEPATAASIGFNFANSYDPVAPPGNGTAVYNLAPTDVTGVVPQAHWNNLYVNNPLSVPVVDDQGLPAGSVQFTASPQGISSIVPAGSPAGNLLHSMAEMVHLTMFPVPYAHYDVYLYFASPQAPPGNIFTADLNVTGLGPYLGSYYVDLTGSSQFIEASSIFAGSLYDPGVTAGNYVRVANRQSSLLTIIASAPLAGVQIVAVPEPGSVALLFVALPALCWCRRKRRAE